MEVIRAAAMGLCFGVRDALQTASDVHHSANVTIHGELVHNPEVLVQLTARGFQMLPEQDRHLLPTTPTVLVTAHGISDRERNRLLSAGKHLIDTTCPLVKRVHDAAQRLARDGFHILLIGRPGHIEVQGIADDLSSCDVLPSVEHIQTWPHSRLGVICQTTTPPRHAHEIVAAIRAKNPHAEVRFINTICLPTMERQIALEQLCHAVDAIVVVGGANSNNTRQLVQRALDLGTPAWQIQTAGDLRPEWFQNCRRVGLTAGTSTLDQTVEEVYQALAALSPP
jgi:4-hydroxy-3-methylbut-2-enyl diphosphate reductase